MNEIKSIILHPNNNQIAVFSDIHGNYQALSAILKDIKSRGITSIICLGDIMSLGPNPKECLDLIIDNNINMIIGNHELYYLKGTNNVIKVNNGEKHHHNYTKECQNKKHKEFLEKIPMRIICNIGGKQIYFQHFIFVSNKNELYPFDKLDIIKNNQIKDKLTNLDCDILFIGHEHYKFNIEYNNKKIICVGSSGCLENDNTFYNIISLNNNIINIEQIDIKYDRKTFEETINNMENPEKNNVYKNFFGMHK